MAGLNLIVVRNPFDRRDRDVSVVPYDETVTIASLRVGHFPNNVELSVSVNGALIPQGQWETTHPKDGDQIVMVPALRGGGDDNKSILRMIAFIALTIVAMPIAVSLLPVGASLTMIYIGTALVYIAGGAMINHLLPPPKPQVPTASLDSGQSSAYSWSPQTTQQQGLPIARWYGTNKLYGNIISVYIENDGDKQYLNALIDLGQGPYQNIGILGNGSRNFWINDQPDKQFQGVQIEVRRGRINQGVIARFNDTRIARNVAVKVVSGTPYTYVTPGTGFDALEIEVTFPQGLWYANDAGGLDNYSVGIEIAVKRSSDLTWTVLTTEVVTTSVVVTTERWSLGRWTQISSSVRSDGEIVWQEYAAGSTDPYAHAEGEEEAHDGAWWYWNWKTIETTQQVNTTNDYTAIVGNRTQPIRRVFRAVNLQPGSYDVKVTNHTPDQTGTRYGDDVYLSTVTEVLYDDFAYPRTVLVGIRALATDQLSGSLQFSCLAECALVRIWTGTIWMVGLSSNPAWVCYDILTQPVLEDNNSVVRYDGIDPTRVDLTAFLDWANFCDELVPDGEGGTEKRCEFNGGFDSDTTMWDAALQVCQVARAILVWNGTNLTVVIDRARSTPTQLFTVGNIGADSFRETFLSMSDRVSEIEVDFINHAMGYVRDKLTVVNTSMTSTVNKINLQLVGVTRASQAWREAMFRLYRNQYITRTCEIDVDVDSIACTIGDLILIQHDVPVWGYGGRVVSATTNAITLDQEVLIEVAKTYEIMVRLVDDTLITRTVSNAPGVYSTLTVSTPFSPAPSPYDVYAFGEATLETKPFVVLAITRNGDQQATLSCVEYNASIYNVDSGQPAIPTLNYSALDILPNVTNFVIAEGLVLQKDGTVATVIDVTWERPLSAIIPHVEIWWTDGTGWQLAGQATGQSFRLWGVRDLQTYTIVALSVNFVGFKTKIQNSPQATIYVIGKTAPPPTPEQFLVSVQPDGTREFNWTLTNPPADLAGFLVRYYLGSTADWEVMTPLNKGVLTASKFESNQLAAGTYTFAIKAIDTSGNESTDASFIETAIGDPRLAGVIADYDEAPTWTGTKTDCHADGVTGWLVADGLDTWADLPATWAGWTVWNTTPEGTIQYLREIDVGIVTTFQPLVSITYDGTPTVEESHSDDGVSWSAYAVIAGQLLARYIRIRVTVTGAYPKLYTMRTYLSAATIVEYIEDLDTSTISSPAGTVVLPLTKTFAIIKSVSITLQSVGGGWTWELINKSTSGPTIKIYNGTPALADAVIDATVIGL